MRKASSLLLLVAAVLTIISSFTPARATCNVYIQGVGCVEGVVCRTLHKFPCTQ